MNAAHCKPTLIPNKSAAVIVKVNSTSAYRCFNAILKIRNCSDIVFASNSVSIRRFATICTAIAADFPFLIPLIEPYRLHALDVHAQQAACIIRIVALGVERLELGNCGRFVARAEHGGEVVDSRIERRICECDSFRWNGEIVSNVSCRCCSFDNTGLVVWSNPNITRNVKIQRFVCERDVVFMATYDVGAACDVYKLS